MAIEIERKFLVKEKPFHLEKKITTHSTRIYCK